MRTSTQRTTASGARGLAIAFGIVLGSVSVLAACGGDDDVALGADEPAASTTTVAPDATDDPDAPVSAPANDPGSTTPPAAPTRVTPTGDAVDVVPVSFDVNAVKAVDDGVLVRFWGGVEPCFALDRYTVNETDTTVTIGLFAGRPPGSGDVACIELAMEYEVQVPLSAPLGTRTVVDASAA
jgi:hypothetical protein